MTVILMTHIVFMVLSIIATAGSALWAATGRRVVRAFTITNRIVTVVGVAAGTVLLADAPLGARCALLFGYVVGFSLAQYFISRTNYRLASVLSK